MSDTTGRKIAYATLVFTALMIGIISMMAGFAPTDSQDFQDFNASFTKFEEIRATQAEATDKVDDATPDSTEGSDLGILEGLLKGVWGALEVGWDSVTTMTTMLEDLSNVLDVPLWFTNLLIALIGITMAFVIMSAIFKWRI